MTWFPVAPKSSDRSAGMNAIAPPILSTPRLVVRMGNYLDIAAVTRYYRVNRDFLTPFEPTRPEEFFTESFWQVQLERSLLEFEQDRSLRLFIFEATQPQVVIGSINFNQFFRGPMQACVMGYSLATAKQHQGYMLEALTASIRYVFEELNFHRIMANYMPRNQRSGNLLKKLGFVVEGYARDYLLINGEWEDHVLTSLIQPGTQMRTQMNANERR
jgi:[ribosomal protein S5]-alanine N-acetyltransferase